MRLAEALSESCVQHWFQRVKRRRVYLSFFRSWLRWLWRLQDEQEKKRGSPGYVPRVPEELLHVRLPSELLEFQENAEGRLKYAILDLIQDYVQEKGGTYTSMVVRLSNIRSFWRKNRVEIPEAVDWEPEPTREPTQGQLDVPKVREIVMHSNLRDQAVFLTMFQGMMDKERFTRFNRKYAEALVTHLKSRDLGEPFRIDFMSGRKRNRRAFPTYIYKDSLKAWETYFNRIRGWPKPDEPIALDKAGKAITKSAISDAFDTVAKELRIKPKNPTRDIGFRSGVAPHEAFRDVVRTLVQTARKKKFDPIVAELFMGHSIDRYNYVKMMEQQPEYVLENAKILSEYLNIMSSETTYENKSLWKAQMEAMEAKLTILSKMVQAMREERKRDLA